MVAHLRGRARRAIQGILALGARQPVGPRRARSACVSTALHGNLHDFVYMGA